MNYASILDELVKEQEDNLQSARKKYEDASEEYDFFFGIKTWFSDEVGNRRFNASVQLHDEYDKYKKLLDIQSQLEKKLGKNFLLPNGFSQFFKHTTSSMYLNYSKIVHSKSLCYSLLTDSLYVNTRMISTQMFVFGDTFYCYNAAGTPQSGGGAVTAWV